VPLADTLFGVSFEHHIGRPHLTHRANDDMVKEDVAELRAARRSVRSNAPPQRQHGSELILEGKWHKKVSLGTRTQPFTLSENDIGSSVRRAGVWEWAQCSHAGSGCVPSGGGGPATPVGSAISPQTIP